MPKKPLETKEDIDKQEEHIRELQRRAEELVGGELSFFESEDMSHELRGTVLGTCGGLRGIGMDHVF